MAFYSHMISHAPHRPLLYVSFGDVLRSRGQTAQAMQLYRQALELNPIYDLALGGVAACYRDQGNDAEAQRWYERALQTPNGAMRPALHNDMGVLYLKQGHVEQAIAEFRRAAALQPYRVECWANLGRAYAQRNQIDRAIEAFKRALALDPNHVGSHTHLGNLCVLQHQYRDAILHYQQATHLQSDPRVYLNLGICYLHLGQPDLAKQAWEQALKLKPDYDEAKVNLALLKRSAIH